MGLSLSDNYTKRGVQRAATAAPRGGAGSGGGCTPPDPGLWGSDGDRLGAPRGRARAPPVPAGRPRRPGRSRPRRRPGPRRWSAATSRTSRRTPCRVSRRRAGRRPPSDGAAGSGCARGSHLSLAPGLWTTLSIGSLGYEPAVAQSQPRCCCSADRLGCRATPRSTEMTEPDAHTQEPHAASLASRLNWLRAGVLGANDGIVSTAGLVVGVAGATTDRTAILVAGLAGLVAGALSMAGGEYVSVSTQADTERAAIRRRGALGAREHAPRTSSTSSPTSTSARGSTPTSPPTSPSSSTAHDALAAHAEAELGIDPDERTQPAGTRPGRRWWPSSSARCCRCWRSCCRHRRGGCGSPFGGGDRGAGRDRRGQRPAGRRAVAARGAPQRRGRGARDARHVRGRLVRRRLTSVSAPRRRSACPARRRRPARRAPPGRPGSVRGQRGSTGSNAISTVRVLSPDT